MPPAYAACLLCKEIDDSEHVLFVCPRFNAYRMIMEAAVGTRLGVANFIDANIASKKITWAAAKTFAYNVMTHLRTLERADAATRRMPTQGPGGNGEPYEVTHNTND